MKSPIVLLRSLLIDFRRLDPCVKGLDRDIRTIERRFKHEGYGFLTVTLPSLGAAFDEGLSTGCFRCPTAFRKASGSVLPRFISGLLSEVFDPVTGLVKPDVPDGVVVTIRQLTMGLKKVRLDDESSDELHLKAVNEFFRCDDLIDQTDMSDRDEHHYLNVCRYVLPNLRRECDPLHHEDDPSRLRHGPGAVAEGYRSNQKWLGVVKGILTDAFDTAKYGYDMFSLNSRLCSSQSFDENSVADKDSAIFRAILSDWNNPKPLTAVASRSIAKLVSVAKNSTSRRTITIEPLLKQFVQQGLNSELRDSISQCKILSLCLALTDQSKNQKLALEGSKHRNWSTIDLKSASDLLSIKMVERTFKESPEFLGELLDCRSSSISIHKEVRDLRKYAGMGNATTFPVQSVVFACLAIAAIVDDGRSRPSYWKVKRASRCVRVYGDDIIIKTEYAHTVVAWLTKAGLIVNSRKSFLDGYFKESCGVDAYKGVDVTPLYLRHRPDDSSMDPNAIAGLIAFSNNSWMRGYYETSACVAREVEERLGYSLPLVSRNSSALGWHSRIDSMNPTKWDRTLQRFVTEAPVLSSLKRKDKLDGHAALLKFFHVPLIGRPLKHLQESSMRFKLKIARKRVPTEVG